MQRPQNEEIVRIPSSNLKQCPICRGTGKDGRDRPCKVCEATGKISTRNIDDLPPPALEKPERPNAAGQASLPVRVIGANK